MDTTLKPINQSQVKLWRHCQRAWYYKYDRNLVPRRKAAALFRGSWFHRALETHYKLGDWKIGYNEYLEEWNKLFDEEKELINERSKGHLPTVIKGMMKSYLWYYRNESWKPIIIERTFDFVWGGIRFKGTIDFGAEDEDGYLWIFDHKTVTSIPPSNAFHGMDPQLNLYPWAAKQAWNLDVHGVIYNYIRAKTPTVPSINKDGSLSRRKIVTDYPTAYRFLKDNGYDPRGFSDFLKPLARSSPFLRRYRLPREDGVTATILQEYMTTAKQIYDHKQVVRTITRDCVRCDYQMLCQADLNGMDTRPMIKAHYQLEDTEEKHGEYDQAEPEDDEWEDL